MGLILVGEDSPGVEVAIYSGTLAWKTRRWLEWRTQLGNWTVARTPWSKEVTVTQALPTSRLCSQPAVRLLLSCRALSRSARRHSQRFAWTLSDWLQFSRKVSPTFFFFFQSTSSGMWLTVPDCIFNWHALTLDVQSLTTRPPGKSLVSLLWCLFISKSRSNTRVSIVSVSGRFMHLTVRDTSEERVNKCGNVKDLLTFGSVSTMQTQNCTELKHTISRWHQNSLLSHEEEVSTF